MDHDAVAYTTVYEQDELDAADAVVDGADHVMLGDMRLDLSSEYGIRAVCGKAIDSNRT